MKKFLVVLLALAMVFGLGSVAFAADTQIADYTDLAGVPAEQQAAIYRLTALGVLAGDGIGGDFRPEDTITRAEFAKIAIYLAGKADAVDLYASFAPAFADVQDGTWYEGYVNAAVAFGYMKGYADDTFKPGQTVTMQEVATVLLRIAGYTDALKGEWPNDYIRKANDTEIIAYVDFVGPRAATRADVASIANETLDLWMVAEVENEVAAGLGFVMGGIVDEDGFTYIENKTNEDNIWGYDDDYMTVLNYAFDCIAVEDIFAFNNDDIETSGWNFEDYAEGELNFIFLGTQTNFEVEVATDYYVYGADFFAYANHSGIVTYNVDDEEIVFVEITSTREVVEEYDVDDYDFANNDAKDDIADNSYGYVWMNDDEEVYAGLDMADYEEIAWDIVEKIEEDDEDVEFVFAETDLTTGLDITFDTEEIEETVIFIKDGEFVAYDDVEATDVLFGLDEVADVEENDEYPVYLVVSPIEGEMNKLYTKTQKEIKLDDVVYVYGTVETQYSNDNGDEYVDADYPTLYADDLEEVAYVPHYAWKNVAAIIADIEDTTDTFYAVVLGYEVERKASHTVEDGVEFVEEVEAIIVFTEEGEELTLTFDDLDEVFEAYTNGAYWTTLLANLPNVGDAVEITVNEDDEITVLDLYVPYDNLAYNAATTKNTEVDVKANGRVKFDSDWYTIDANTVIMAITSEDAEEVLAKAIAGTDTFTSADFEKAEIIDVDDVLGAKMTVTYAYAEMDGRHVDYIYVVDAELSTKAGDITLAIADEHFQKKGVEYISLTTGDALAINEDAEGLLDAMDNEGLYPVVVLYMLADEELTGLYDGGDLTKGEIAELVWADGSIAEADATALIQQFYDDEDYSVVIDTPDYTTYDKDMQDIVFDGGDTYYFGDVKVIDLTDDCEELTMKRAAKIADEENYSFFMIIHKQDGVVAAYMFE